MPKFHCTGTSVEPPDRFVFVGRVLAGKIEPGMQVLVPLNSSMSIAYDIVAVNHAKGVDPVITRLVVVECDEDGLLEAMDVRGEDLEVVWPDAAR